MIKFKKMDKVSSLVAKYSSRVDIFFDTIF